MAYSHIAHCCNIGNQVIIANAVQIAGHVTVEDQAVSYTHLTLPTISDV